MWLFSQAEKLWQGAREHLINKETEKEMLSAAFFLQAACRQTNTLSLGGGGVTGQSQGRKTAFG